MRASLGRIVIYTRKIPEMVAFYERYFGYEGHQVPGDRIVELRPAGAGASILLHPLGKGRKEGQTLVKLVFDVRDVEGFCREAKAMGLKFGPLHQGGGYVFSNAADPSGNPVQVSGRAFAAPGYPAGEKDIP